MLLTAAAPLLLVALACVLDRLLGDPRWCLHPVVVMGWLITRLRCLAERWAGDSPWTLRLAGTVITALLVGGSALAGWGVERLALVTPVRPIAVAVLLIGLASALAGRSLAEAVRAVLVAEKAGDLPLARQRLSWIVGRDTDGLDGPEILRAAAETASENAVDGLFAPLFWMVVGAACWGASGLEGPGPLALAWGFKAASTLDSMLGYRSGRLRWLGTAGARLDDLLVWLPCRLAALSLPLVAGQGPRGCWRHWRLTRRDGAPDPSPNAGLSQAAYAHAAGVQLGGINHYGAQRRANPLLAAGQPLPTAGSVERMLELTRRLELLWLLPMAALGMLQALVLRP